MALESWLAFLKSDVTAVTPVQAPVHAGLRRNGRNAADVTGVTYLRSMAACETSVTAMKNQTLQPKPAWALGCTPVTPVTAKISDGGAVAASDLLSGGLLTATRGEPRRLFRQCGPWLTRREAMDAKAYHAHHFNCRTCIAAGRGTPYGGRCAAGLALWTTYTGADDLQTERA